MINRLHAFLRGFLRLSILASVAWPCSRSLGETGEEPANDGKALTIIARHQYIFFHGVVDDSSSPDKKQKLVFREKAEKNEISLIFEDEGKTSISLSKRFFLHDVAWSKNSVWFLLASHSRSSIKPAYVGMANLEGEDAGVVSIFSNVLTTGDHVRGITECREDGLSVNLLLLKANRTSNLAFAKAIVPFSLFRPANVNDLGPVADENEFEFKRNPEPKEVVEVPQGKGSVRE